MADGSWRRHARPIIARVLKETQGQDEQAVRKALKEAYPFGERKYWPYKVWCDEVQRQMHKRRQRDRRGRIVVPDPNQMDFFTEEA